MWVANESSRQGVDLVSMLTDQCAEAARSPACALAMSSFSLSRSTLAMSIWLLPRQLDSSTHILGVLVADRNNRRVPGLLDPY